MDNSPSVIPDPSTAASDIDIFPRSQADKQHETSEPQSLRQTHHRPSTSSQHSPNRGSVGNAVMNKLKGYGSSPVDRVSTSHSMSSRQTRTSISTRAENIAANRAIRTLPPWIDSYETDTGDHEHNIRVTDRLLPPSPIHSASHHFGSTPTATQPSTPSPGKRVSHDGWVDDDDTEASSGPAEKTPERNLFGTVQKPMRGRKWDHARSGAPIIIQNDNGRSNWIPFIKSSMYGPALDEEGKRVDPDFLKDLTPGYEKPWRGDLEGEDAENALGLFHKKGRRRVWYKQLQHTLLTHPLVPLGFRLTTFVTSVIALGISARIFDLSNSKKIPQNPSTSMAIVVDVIGMPYIGYVTWDEYTGKPLGLRSPKAKIRLVLLDLFFIIFESANASLAFDALTDQEGACRAKGPEKNQGVCGRQAALGAVLLVALVAWSLTFAVSIFRLVERVGGREEEDD